MRVLLISHTCQSRCEGQPLAAELGRFQDIDLRVLVPDQWNESGQWRFAQKKLDDSYELEVSKIHGASCGFLGSRLHHYPHLAQTLREFRPHIIDVREEPSEFVSAQVTWMRNRFAPQA